MSGSVAVVSAPPAASSSVAASVVVPSSAAPSGSAAPASVAASIVPSSQPLPLSSSPPSAAPTTLTTSTTPASITASASASGEPFCVAFQDPHVGSTGTEYCMCGTETTSYYSMVTTEGNPCPYTTDPPASLTVNPHPVSTTPISPECATPTVISFDTASCWNDLSLSDYVSNWWSANSGNCGGTSSDGSASSFANCWYKLSTKYSPAICNVLNADAPCPKPNWADFSDHENPVEDFWVTWAIYNTNDYWLNMYTAINDAGGYISGVTGKVISTLNPPDPTEGQTPAWEYVLDALTFGLSLYSEGSLLTKAFLRSLPQTSTLITKVYPQGDVSGTVTQWSDVQGAVSEFCKTWADSIGGVLPIVLDDPVQFVNSASAAQMTQGVEDLSGLTDAMYSALGTYLVSGAVDATGFVITRTANTDVNALQIAGGLMWDTGCGSGYTNNFCGGIYYYDGTDTYSLINKGKFQEDQTELFNSLFGGDDPLVIAGEFFTGSLKCSQTSGQNGGGQPTVDSSDISSFSCLANARVCTWDWNSPSPFVPDCTSDDMPKIGDGTCDPYSSEIGSSGCAPKAYLTGAIFGYENEPDGFSMKTYCNQGCSWAGGGDNY